MWTKILHVILNSYKTEGIAKRLNKRKSLGGGAPVNLNQKKKQSKFRFSHMSLINTFSNFLVVIKSNLKLKQPRRRRRPESHKIKIFNDEKQKTHASCERLFFSFLRMFFSFNHVIDFWSCRCRVCMKRPTKLTCRGSS